MNRLEAKTTDMYNLNSSFSYLGEEENDIDISIKGNPIPDTIKKDGQTKGVIGRIGGIGADSNEPTRNGRRYPLKLWQNVENSEYFIEGMKNRCIVGECDHPSERLDYSITEGAIVLTKYDIQDDGKVYTEFDILDTLPGRTLKTYFDAGCKLGVSSRGLGEEIIKDGEKIIDPETYQFYCFDAVVFPAVKSARMELIESTSPKKQNLVNSIKSEINNCKTLDEVLFIENTSKDVNLYLDEIKESIDNKKASLSNKAESYESTKSLFETLINSLNDNSSSFWIWLNESYGEYSEKCLKDLIDSLSNKNDKSSKKNTNEDENDNTKILHSTVKNKNNKIKISDDKIKSDEDTTDSDKTSDLKTLAEYEENLNELITENKVLKNQINQKCEVIKNLVSKNHTKDLKITEHLHLSQKLISKQHNYKQIENEKLSLRKQIESLKDQLSLTLSKYEKLQLVNKEFSTMFENLNNAYNSKNKLNESLLRSKTSKLIESRNKHSEDNKKIISLNESIDQLNSTVISLKESLKSLEKENDVLRKENSSIKNEKLKQNKTLKELSNNNKLLNKKYIESLDNYISSVCTKYNIKESTLRRLLGKSYGVKEIDKAANEIVENISKINSLPFTHIVPDRQIISENIGLQDSFDSTAYANDIDNFHFMLESKK